MDVLNDFTNLIAKGGPADYFAQVQPLREPFAPALRLAFARSPSSPRGGFTIEMTADIYTHTSAASNQAKELLWLVSYSKDHVSA